MSDKCFLACSGFELDTWPIPVAAVIYSETINEVHLMVICIPDGSLGLRVLRDGETEDYETDIIIPESNFKVVLSIDYTPLKPAIRINGSEIESARVGMRIKNTFHLRSQPTLVPLELSTPSQYVPDQATHAEALFVRTVGDLYQASQSNDWYTILKSSAPLRLLLLDGLLHNANERYNLKIQFRVADTSQPPPIEYDKLWHSISPEGLPHHNVTYFGLDKFLKLRVFESPIENITVKDVIRAAAHGDGGVHFDPTGGSLQEGCMLDLDKGSMRMGQTASRRYLQQICLVVVESTMPLLAMIQGDQ